MHSRIKKAALAFPVGSQVKAMASGWVGHVVAINRKNPSSPIKVRWANGETSNCNVMVIERDKTMATSRKSEFWIGIILDDAMAQAMCKKLRFVCELVHGDFSFYFHEGCTIFRAPRLLGTDRFRIARACLQGFKLGLLGS